MDRIDRQIVHCLQRDGRAPFRRIAEVLEVSEQTVARRFRALTSDGALRVLVLPNPQASGDQTWMVRIQCRPDSADALAESIAARDDVQWVSVTSGGSELTCVTRSRPDAAHQTVLLDRLPRTHQVLSFAAFAVLRIHVGGDAEWLAFDDPLSDDQVARLLDGATASAMRRGPTPSAEIRDEDAPLITELARDGRVGVVALAKATGWPQSRVSARLDELFASGAVQVDVDLSPYRFGFRSMAYVWLTVAPGDLETTGKSLSRYRETSFAAAVTGAANLMTAVTCRDPDELYRYVTTKVGSLPAVRQAEVVPVLRRVKQAGTLVRGGRLELAPR